LFFFFKFTLKALHRDEYVHGGGDHVRDHDYGHDHDHDHDHDRDDGGGGHP